MSVVDEFGRSKQVSLTTYRKSGAAVSTPVWYAINGGELFIVSETAAGKVKRIRNNNDVVVTACTFRGQPMQGGATAHGTARLLDEAATLAARKLLARRYIMSRMGNAFARLLRLKRPPLIGIAITF
jgi:uncharacterized protein